MCSQVLLENIFRLCFAAKSRPGFVPSTVFFFRKAMIEHLLYIVNNFPKAALSSNGHVL